MRNGINILVLVIACAIPGNPAISQQVNLPRVEAMPSIPSPYVMRDWAGVARKYDSLVYDVDKTGLNWPLVILGSSGINYPAIKPVFMDSYVGSDFHGTQSEAINVIPSIVGATLVGIDKSDEFGVNWVELVKDFFNKRNGQNVYLNGSSSNSGNDWWYDVMPNVFFYQLYSLYPRTIDFDVQFASVANVWQGAVHKMGGSATPWKVPHMNYRAWNLATQTPLASGVIEPEAAGSLGWLMYNAYNKQGDKNYLYTAQMCMDFLNGLISNPSYEIQLPYGALTAARMNAELGSAYDVGKMLNWVFNRGPLRDWGTITGTWDGKDVSGLVGEANDAGNDYAFLMNGFQQAAALVPLVKYDKRFARAIAKWMLNLANASRLFYTAYLPEDHQDSYSWSTQNDPGSVIGHESLKQVWNNVNLYARGDAVSGGWANTDLSLYSSSHVGYLGAIVHKTDVDGILSLDMNKTDFFGNNSFPHYLVYNPYGTIKNITLMLDTTSYDIYDAITEKTILKGVSGNTVISVGPDSAILLVYLPAGTTLTEKGENLYSGDIAVDYHYHYNYDGLFRIKSLAAENSLIPVNSKDTVYCTVENAPEAVLYSWSVNGVEVSAGSNDKLTWTAPPGEGSYKISCTVSSGGNEATDTVTVQVVPFIPAKPQITGLQGDKKFYFINDTALVTCTANDINGGQLNFLWRADSGIFADSTNALANWMAPATAGIYTIRCHVESDSGFFADTSLNVLVKPRLNSDTDPMLYYPFDGNVKDYSGNGYDGVLAGAVLTSDALGNPQRAYRFSSSTDQIYTANRPELNFQDKITISFWLKLDQLPEEMYVISHGSWEERYKVSVTPEGKLRWTIKTNVATKDLDNSTSLALNTFYHFTVTYTGYSMETYVNGDLDVFTSLNGRIQQTAKDLVIGHKDRSINSYFLRGTVDELKIFKDELPVSRIKTLPSLWNPYTGEKSMNGSDLVLFPNPADEYVYIRFSGGMVPVSVEAFDLTGRKLAVNVRLIDPATARINMVNPVHGLVVFKLQFIQSQKFVKVIFK